MALESFHEPLVEAARQTVDAALADASIDTSGIDITPTVEQGAPARVLIDTAANAELLVVGSRGLGGFRGLLLGSVSQQCAQGATCPVVIVPPTRSEGGEATGGNDQ
ncbi:universal stress protein [Nocardia vinacea]|uniref:universal stress protein n=1 Tax=Nocardia vinacea TaxID=96468 RepID=UPI0033F7946D